MNNDTHVRIFLDSIELPLRIGIYDDEKTRPQRAVVDVALYADVQDYMRNVSKDNIIDYSKIYNEIRGWTERAHVGLIEDYLKDLVGLCFQHDKVVACRVSLRKVDVFEDNQGAGIEIYTTRGDWEL